MTKQEFIKAKRVVKHAETALLEKIQSGDLKIYRLTPKIEPDYLIAETEEAARCEHAKMMSSLLRECGTDVVAAQVQPSEVPDDAYCIAAAKEAFALQELYYEHEINLEIDTLIHPRFLGNKL